MNRSFPHRRHAVRAPRLALLALLAAAPLAAAAGVPGDLEEYKARIEAERRAAAALDAPAPAPPRAPLHRTQCVGGMAGIYPCSNIDLLEFMPLATFGAGNTNSLWGWTDPVTGKEWVVLGLDNGTAFVDISDPENPYYAGRLPPHGSGSLWRDVRVYRDHAFVVSEASGHGMQIFDLRQLRNATGPPDIFTETGHYDRVSNTHTLSINEQTGRAVLVGTTGTDGNPNVQTCGGNLHLVDLDVLLAILVADFEEGDTSDWTDPTPSAFLGCYNDDAQGPGYVHENQCFVYHGPDAAYTGREICLASRGSASNLDVIDITNPAAPVRIDSFHYQTAGSTYSHQAWFTEDHRYILLNDEFDETDNGHGTRTWIFDAADLDNVAYAGADGYYAHATPSIDHNEYVRGNFVFQSNYTSGLRILELTDLDQEQLTPVAHFDVHPANDAATFDGTWNNYPFFASGVIPVSSIDGPQGGLYLLEPTALCTAPAAPTGLSATAAGDNRIDLAWTGPPPAGVTYRIERALNGCGGTFLPIAQGVATAAYSDAAASGGVVYGYRVRAQVESGLCSSAPSSCDEEMTTGLCTAPPLFAGVESAGSPGTAACAVDLDWSPAVSLCGGPISYSVYRSNVPDFVPTPADLVATGISGSSFTDAQAPALTTVHYVVRATDTGNGAQEPNLVHATARAVGPIGDGTLVSGAEAGEPIFESGSQLAPEHAGWHVESLRVRSGARSYSALPGSGVCETLETTVELSAGQPSALEFWSAVDLDPQSAAGVVELSADGGASWQRLTPQGGYPTTFQGGGDGCAIAAGDGVVAGVGLVDFARFEVDLAPWPGQTIRLRWLLRSDSPESGEGWSIDDVAVAHAQVPTACANP
jgi:choice-of-anchor B domain-containing protein